MSEEKNTIKDKILQAIKSGEVKMRPRWQFILQSVLFSIGLILIALVLLYIISFIIFILHRTGVWFVPGFGLRAFGTFFFSLPWVLILVAILFIVMLEVLVRHYEFAYRRPLLYSAIGAIVIVIAGGVVISHTSLHSQFFRFAREGRLPIAGNLYRDMGTQRFRNIHPGTITEITDNGFKMNDIKDESVRVTISSETRFPQGTNFAVNDRVLVMGEKEGASTLTIKADGIRKIDQIDHAPVPPGRMSGQRTIIRFR